MSRVIKLGQIKTPTPSPGYIGYYPGFQDAADTTLLDRSGKNNHAALGANLVAAGTAFNGTANRFSVPLNSSGTQNNSANLPYGTAFQWNPATESLLIACKVTATATASNGPLFGISHGNPRPGFKLEILATSGAVRMLRYSASAATGGTASAAALANGSERSYVFAWDCQQAGPRVFHYIDGAIDANLVGGTLTTATDWYPSDNPNFCIGGSGHTSGNSISFAASFRGIHIAKRTGPLPANIADLVARLHQFPHVLISAAELPA